ncbi:MAG: glycosyltransferase [Candidatus Bathyarchaeia archaeon]
MEPIIVLATAPLLLISFFYLFLVWNVKTPARPATYFPKVTVMAYAWQSGNVIRRKIENFLSQDYPKDRFEVIIYDNQSTDETPIICRQYEEAGLIKYYRPKVPYDRKAPVLDEAIGKVATGDFIALTDPDGVCEREWVKKIIQPFIDPRVGAVSGITHCGNWHKNLFTRLRAIEDEWWNNISYTARNGKIRLTRFQPLCGCNYAIRRRTWEDIGRSHGRGLLEDLELSIRLHSKGWLVEVADAHVWQEEVEDIGQYVRQRRRWYSFKSSQVIGEEKRLDRIIGGLPQGIQMTGIISLIFFLALLLRGVTSSGIDQLELCLAASPFIMHNLALTAGIVKVKRRNLLPYIPVFTTFDALLQLLCFLEVRLRWGREQRWVMLGLGKYYHSGTEIRIDGP